MPEEQLHHAVDGPTDAPVLVLSNSLGTTLRMWEPQVPALAERFRVVRYDMRGHGDSPVPPGPYTIGDLGGDILRLLDRLEVETAHVAGISIGGMASLWLAAHHPERVDRLVALCTSAALGPAETWVERAETVRTSGTVALADTVVSRWLTPGFTAERPDTREWLRAMIVNTPDDGYAACCAAIARMDLRPDLNSIVAPTLVVAAEHDPSTPPEHGRLIAEGIPSARLEVIPGAAHLANVERPDEVTRLLVRHLTA